jgi:hypothetical protein
MEAPRVLPILPPRAAGRFREIAPARATRHSPRKLRRRIPRFGPGELRRRVRPRFDPGELRSPDPPAVRSWRIALAGSARGSANCATPSEAPRRPKRVALPFLRRGSAPFFGRNSVVEGREVFGLCSWVRPILHGVPDAFS